MDKNKPTSTIITPDHAGVQHVVIFLDERHAWDWIGALLIQLRNGDAPQLSCMANFSEFDEDDQTLTVRLPGGEVQVQSGKSDET